MSDDGSVDILKLREALEASWDSLTSNQNVVKKGNPALGQCYPTSRVVQFFFPEMEIVEGKVSTNSGDDQHFWNTLKVNEIIYHIDLTWQQFPPGSRVLDYKIRDRNKFGDRPETTERLELLLSRVSEFLNIKT